MLFVVIYANEIKNKFLKNLSILLTSINYYDKLNTVVIERARNAKTNEKQQ